MTIVYAVLAVLGLHPLARAWYANRGTSLLHAVAWATAAWGAWAWAFWGGDREPGLDVGRYVALGLTGAAGVAVLGARRPYVFAWNFVVLGLLAVMLWPMVESLLVGTHPADPLRNAFLAATLAVGLVNYLPTRAAPAVVLLTPALAGEALAVFAPSWLPDRAEQFFDLLILLAPWAAWGCWYTARPARSEFDCLWLDFRDRFGLVWSQRVREQFNNAARHAGWPVQLGWRGLRRTSAREAIAPSDQDAMLDTLRKALQRFM